MLQEVVWNYGAGVATKSIFSPRNEKFLWLVKSADHYTDHSVKISMDGRGRYQDNILVERLWRTVKYEEVYLKAYANGLEARNGLREYFRFYNHRRPHQALGYRTPAEVFHGEPVEEELKERRCPDQRDLVSYEGVQESHLIVA